MVHKHDTIILLTRRAKDGHYFWRTEQVGGAGKDRGGRPLFKDIDYTNDGLVASYLATIGGY